MSRVSFPPTPGLALVTYSAERGSSETALRERDQCASDPAAPGENPLRGRGFLPIAGRSFCS